MTIERYRHPVLFYGLATAVSWAFWFTAAYLSHRTPGSELLTVAASISGIVGLASPTIVAAAMIASNTDLRTDVLRRLFTFKGITPVYLFLTCFLMLASILLAQGISLLFGYDASQFQFSGRMSFSAGIFPAWFLLFLAPLLEELAWHSYGTDCLRQRFNLLATSLVFAVYWALWHMPLSFIKDYYQSNLVGTGWIYSLNFALSLIPYVVLMNWLYYKTRRNMSVAILFHITAGVFNEMFQTHPDSKIIQTLLLLALSIGLVLKERNFFLEREYSE